MRKNKFIAIFHIALIVFTPKIWAVSEEQELLAPEVQASMHSSIINPVEPHLIFASKEEANAWLSDMSNRLKKWIPDQFLRNRYLTIIQYEAKRAGLDPQIILSVITVESKFNKYAIPPNGDAQGMMQVRPFWRSLIGRKNQSLFDVRTNIRYGCTILRYYLQKNRGNMASALAQYNGSPNKTWYPQKVFAAYNKYWTPATFATIKNGEIKYINYARI